ncbi:MAG: Rpn family recombination-promoting nuclease/putative transposase [Puniceicoccales bacterium]|jgi:predicted transposase/invertase (TIGR01784 family)|nr:Rpn family recombination-promoting nuclease/putative transposase [Puniceicoccales bacterium]
MRRFLDPKNDLTFKRLFGTEQNKEILIAFLNDIFAGVHEPLVEVEFLKTIQDPEIAIMRQSIVDVLCRDAEGKQYIIEMQCALDSSFLKRACYYASRAYVSQVTSGKPFSQLKQVIFLAIFKDQLFPRKGAYLSHHKIQDIHTGECDIDAFSFSFLELGKIDKSFNECQDMIEKWAYFFQHASETDSDSLEEIIQNYPVLGNAYNALGEWGYDNAELLEYDRYAMKADEIATGLSDAEVKGLNRGLAKGLAKGMAKGLAKGKAEGLAKGKAKGLAKGKAEGLAEGKAEATRAMVMKLHQQGIDLSVIAGASNLSPEEIKQILMKAGMMKE